MWNPVWGRTAGVCAGREGWKLAQGTLHPQSGPGSRGCEEGPEPDGCKGSLKNARPGSEDRLLAAEIAGRRAGEADAIKKGLFVHPEEKIQTRREKSKWRAGRVLCLLPHYKGKLFLPRGGGRGRGTLSTLGLPRPHDGPVEHTVEWAWAWESGIHTPRDLS